MMEPWMWHTVIFLGGMALGGFVALLGLILARLDDRDSRRDARYAIQPQKENAPWQYARK